MSGNRRYHLCAQRRLLHVLRYVDNSQCTSTQLQAELLVYMKNACAPITACELMPHVALVSSSTLSSPPCPTSISSNKDFCLLTPGRPPSLSFDRKAGLARLVHARYSPGMLSRKNTIQTSCRPKEPVEKCVETEKK